MRFAAFAQGREGELRFVKMLDEASASLAASNTDELAEALAAWIRRLKREYSSGASVGSRASSLFKLPVLDENIEQAIAGTQSVAAWNIFSRLERLKPGIAEGAELSSLHPAFREGVEWFTRREILTVEEARSVSAAVRVLTDGLTDAEINRAVRSKVLALAGAPNEAITARVQNLVAAAADSRKTYADFIEALQESRESGAWDSASNAYLSNVYRTETGLLYNAQRQAILDDPDMAEGVWGKEFFNPDDDRSRPSHAAIDGVRVKLGGPADEASKPPPPFHFQCRCTFGLIMEGEDDAVETRGALEIMQNIERFPA